MWVTCGRAEAGGEWTVTLAGGTPGAAALGPAAAHSDGDTAAARALAWPSEVRAPWGNRLSNDTSQPAARARSAGLPRMCAGHGVVCHGGSGLRPGLPPCQERLNQLRGWTNVPGDAPAWAGDPCASFRTSSLGCHPTSGLPTPPPPPPLPQLPGLRPSLLLALWGTKIPTQV